MRQRTCREDGEDDDARSASQAITVALVVGEEQHAVLEVGGKGNRDEFGRET
jgi:hypothetical protein